MDNFKILKNPSNKFSLFTSEDIKLNRLVVLSIAKKNCF